jgi:short-subunit dehydrogenase
MSQIKFTPKKINEQTILITGASSGIGRATALLAAEKGAKIVLAARSEEDLKDVAEQITKIGSQALVVATDVSKKEDLENLREKAIAKFGHIDTWINNAGTSIYGYLLDADIEEERKLFETNFWGARIGSRLAVEAMKDNGGVIINLGSEVSVASQPLLGIYSASKHALKAFTDALRSELRDRNYPIEICLVRPTAIDTMFADHGANRLPEGEPSLPAPLYQPEVAAEAILKCAEHPQRDVYVGGPARLSAILDTFFPKVKDMMAESSMKELRKGTGKSHTLANENLYDAPEENEVHGTNEGKHHDRSLYTDITTMNVIKTLKDNFKSSLKEYRKDHSH